jgi:hypothetical protein
LVGGNIALASCREQFAFVVPFSPMTNRFALKITSLCLKIEHRLSSKSNELPGKPSNLVV